MLPEPCTLEGGFLLSSEVAADPSPLFSYANSDFQYLTSLFKLPGTSALSSPIAFTQHLFWDQ
jgi:hypothetical protein